MPEILVQAPAGEPIALAAAKLHLRVTDSSQDALIAMMISAARIAAEMKTRQQLLHARYRYVLDKFPMGGIGTPLPLEHVVSIPGYAIVLPRAPVVDVVSIDYLDMRGQTQTVDPSVYTLNSALMPGILTPRFGQVWPIALPQVGAVSVTYDAGYASPIGAVTPAEGTFTVSGPVSFEVGATVQFYNSGGALPAGLRAQTLYRILTAEDGTYSVTDFYGDPVTITDTGSGSSFLGAVPEGLLNWILIRVGSLYENREEIAVLSRGKVEQLPFIDGLLDPYRVMLP